MDTELGQVWVCLYMHHHLQSQSQGSGSVRVPPTPTFICVRARMGRHIASLATARNPAATSSTLLEGLPFVAAWALTWEQGTKLRLLSVPYNTSAP
jgi:hypothetical protein